MQDRANQDEAEIIALNALLFLTESPNRAEALMHQSGLDPRTIGERAVERHFQAAILDFLLANEALLDEFCRETRTEPRAVHRACHALGGE